MKFVLASSIQNNDEHFASITIQSKSELKVTVNGMLTHCQSIAWYNETTEYRSYECRVKPKDYSIVAEIAFGSDLDFSVISKKVLDHRNRDLSILNSIELSSLSHHNVPLVKRTYGQDEIYDMVEHLLSGRQLTMGEKVSEFERDLANFLKVPYAVSVNSGSSANLLAFSAITNAEARNRLYPGDEVIIPAVCWSTSLYPIIQTGLIPHFVDIDLNTLNLDVSKIEYALTPKTKAILAINVMGNCCDLIKLRDLCEKRNIQLIEDSCESLGTKCEGYFNGTIGRFGTFSFYYSHHITTIEGGAVVCHTFEDYQLLKTLRAHGWIRHRDDKSDFVQQYPNIDPNYMFINSGYNFRLTELQAIMGIHQLRSLNEKNSERNRIRNAICEKLDKSLYLIPSSLPNCETYWFGICLIVKNKEKMGEIKESLDKHRIEHRPIISGNFAKQPYFLRQNIEYSATDLSNSDILHEQGFYIGMCAESQINTVIQALNV